MLRLSETYFGGRHVPIELEVICIRDGRDGDILQQYKRFTEIVDEVTKKHGRTREAAAMIIEQGKQEGVLVAYMAKRGDVEMLDMLTSVFDEEEAQRIHIDTIVREKTQELIKQAEVERLNAIVTTCLNVGLSRETILQQLVEQGNMDRTSAEMFLHSYTDVANNQSLL